MGSKEQHIKQTTKILDTVTVTIYLTGDFYSRHELI